MGKSLSHVQIFATPWTIAHQAPLSMEFSRQEHWSGLPLPSPGDLPDLGIEPGSPTLQADSLSSEPPGKPPKHRWHVGSSSLTRDQLEVQSLSHWTTREVPKESWGDINWPVSLLHKRETCILPRIVHCYSTGKYLLLVRLSHIVSLSRE